jgi:hypothetical protein
MSLFRMVALVVVVAGCSSNKQADRCARIDEKGLADCIEGMTKEVIVDGKSLGKMVSDEDAREKCARSRPEQNKLCMAWPEEMVACVEQKFADRAAWKANEKCQAVMEAQWKKDHPDEK